MLSKKKEKKVAAPGFSMGVGSLLNGARDTGVKSKGIASACCIMGNKFRFHLQHKNCFVSRDM
jgi:hypothetical protein